MRWLPLLLLAGCASPLAQLRSEARIDERTVLRATDVHDADAQAIAEALHHTEEPLARWGGLPETVTVYVVPTHDDLELAVHRRGFSWLRAWSRRDDVIFQAPSTWHARPDVLQKLVVHELTHCLLFQRTGSATDWTERDIPLWFREGMAIQTARQQGQYPGLEDVARWLDATPQLDVFADGDRLSLAQAALVYAFSLHAFAFLQGREGDAKITEFLAAMAQGKTFAESFEPVFGTALAQFQSDFLTFLKFRAFRFNGRSVPGHHIDLQEAIKNRSRQEIDPRPH